jgi:AcrR family transcriptional regulator
VPVDAEGLLVQIDKLNMPRKKEYIEDEVLHKAMHTFWNHGYENASVRILEKDMGINQFSIYASFGNKRELFIEVLKKYKQHVETTFLKDLLQSQGSINDIKKFFLRFGYAIQSGENSNGCLMVNTGMEIGQKDPEIAEQLAAYFGFIKDTFFHCLEKAKLKGVLKPKFDSSAHAEFLLGSLQGMSLYAKFRSKAEIRAYVATILKTLN